MAWGYIVESIELCQRVAGKLVTSFLSDEQTFMIRHISANPYVSLSHHLDLMLEVFLLPEACTYIYEEKSLFFVSIAASMLFSLL